MGGFHQCCRIYSDPFPGLSLSSEASAVCEAFQQLGLAVICDSAFKVTSKVLLDGACGERVPAAEDLPQSRRVYSGFLKIGTKLPNQRFPGDSVDFPGDSVDFPAGPFHAEAVPARILD